MTQAKVRARIAPSPTGHLHLGTARTALYNFLFARKHKGDFILRLEDTDEVRSDDAYTDDILSGLKWLGINWDEGPDIGGPYAPYKQTEKTDHYENVAHKLIEQGKAYFCYATPEELDALREEQRQSNSASRYDNRGRHYTPEQVDKYVKEGRVPVIRFKVEDNRVVSWHDAIKGEIQINTEDLGGDMVIVKSSGIAIYNFAVVVDDVDMKMTHVIRGEDHIHNTAKQILIYEALGEPLPQFAHVPLIFDLDRQKLSKRKHGEAVHINKYRKDGYMPEAIMNYLAQMSWTPADEREIFTVAEACEIFDLDRVSKSPAVFDIKRLDWFNSHYIKSLPIALITERAREFLKDFELSQYSQSELEHIVALVREGLSALKDIAPAAAFFFSDKVQISDELSQGLLKQESSLKVLSKVHASLSQMPWGDAKGCKASVDAIGKELGLKGKDLYWPVRAALCGATSGPDLGSTLSILGERRVKARLEALMQPC
ncbi:MAG: glutamate--tRNA ligase [Candidatus Obscuribacterales bacterium]|nr:glutamate--tRNA ligase [Candidatus Obscuribacterales bacterium]